MSIRKLIIYSMYNYNRHDVITNVFAIYTVTHIILSSCDIFLEK